MTTVNTQRLLGQSAYLVTERNQLRIAVFIDDVRSSYGRTDVLVTPTQGSGSAWVAKDRLEIVTGDQ
jgi:hypothetical protein